MQPFCSPSHKYALPSRRTHQVPVLPVPAPWNGRMCRFLDNLSLALRYTQILRLPVFLIFLILFFQNKLTQNRKRQMYGITFQFFCDSPECMQNTWNLVFCTDCHPLSSPVLHILFLRDLFPAGSTHPDAFHRLCGSVPERTLCQAAVCNCHNLTIFPIHRYNPTSPAEDHVLIMHRKLLRPICRRKFRTDRPLCPRYLPRGCRFRY